MIKYAPTIDVHTMNHHPTHTLNYTKKNIFDQPV